MFESLQDGLGSALKTLRGQGKLSESISTPSVRIWIPCRAPGTVPLTYGTTVTAPYYPKRSSKKYAY